LVRNEVRLARVETAEALKAIGRGSALVATAAVLALLGGLAFLAGVILLVGDQWLPRDLYWLAALIVVLITGAIAIWFARQGMALLTPTQLAPVETVTTIRETKAELAAAVKR
jgi:drug/metabolite transporter (DMT)-like permease